MASKKHVDTHHVVIAKKFEKKKNNPLRYVPKKKKP